MTSGSFSADTFRHDQTPQDRPATRNLRPHGPPRRSGRRRCTEQRLFALTYGVVGNSWQSQLLEARLVAGQVVGVSQRVALPGRADRGARPLPRVPLRGLGAGRRRSAPPRAWSCSTASPGEVSVGPTYEGVATAVSDPTQPRLFFAYGLGLPSDKPIARLTPAGLGVLAATAGLRPGAVSANGQHVYAVRTAFPASGDAGLAVVDSTTGDVLQDITFTTAVGTVGGLTVSRDEHTLWLLSVDCVALCTTRTWTLRRFDVATGTETLAIPFAPVPMPLLESASPPVVDDDTGRVVVATSRTYLGIYHDTTEGAVITFDGASGSEVTRTVVEGRTAIALDASTPAVLAVSQRESRGPDASHSCGGPVVRVFPLPDATGHRRLRRPRRRA